MRNLLALSALLPFIAAAVLAQSPLHLESGVATNTWIVSHQGRPLLRYVFDPRQAKPYIAEFGAPGGHNLLRDGAEDHPHHHGLMYGIKVNGLNFWEESSGCGVQRVVETSATASAHVVTLRQLIHWVSPQDAFLADTAPAALLVERRTLVLTVDDATHEAALEWKAEFEVGRLTNEVVLTGTDYQGLGMRFRSDLDKVANYSYAGRKPDLSDNRHEVSAAKWVSIAFAAPAAPETIMLVPHPANARSNGPFYSMLTPFAYLSATQGLDSSPLVYHSGDKFRLRYLVLAYPELKGTEALEARTRSWH